jgi:hypothetical protein
MGGYCLWVGLEATRKAVGAATAVRVLFSVDWIAMLIDTSEYSALVASSITISVVLSVSDQGSSFTRSAY